MPERALKTFDAEAQDYFLRGMSAARGGKRTIAARLLREAVRLNPYHEQAWLWLSGVLDDRDDVIYCLRSVLDINPTNRRARIGLERLAVTPPATRHALLPVWTDQDEASAYARSRQDTRPSWWAQWREATHLWRLIRWALWLGPLLLLGVTITIRLMLMFQPLPTFATYRDFETSATAVARANVVPPEPTVLAPSVAEDTRHRAELARYWADIMTTRAQLQAAIQRYHAQVSASHTTVERAAAARILAEELDRAQTVMARLSPPSGTDEAHAFYTSGLSEERQAIQDLLSFYSDDDVRYANRAAVRLQNARIQIGEAIAAWSAYARATATSFGDPAPELVDSPP